MEPEPHSDAPPRKRASRASQACVQCREKKVRCDGKSSGCSYCATHALDCSYPDFQKRRGPGKGKQQIKALEDRLARMESLLTRSHSQPRDERAVESGDADAPVLLASSSRAITSEVPVGNVEHLQPNITSESTLQRRLHRFEQLNDRVRQLKRWNFGEHSMNFDTIVDSPVFPQQHEVFLVEGAVEEIFDEFPLSHLPSFLDRVRRRHTMETSERPSWWCFLNAIIAISLHKKTVNKSFSEVSEFGWGFFKNAYAILPQLILQGNDLEVVQALLAMAMFMRNTGDTRTTARLLSVATRTVHTIGLHRKAVGSAWDPVQVETQRRVLWACYILDTDVSFNCGLPIAHSDEISETDVPNEASLDGCGLVKFSERSANIFRLRAHLAVVQSEVARRLYATKLHNKSGPPLLETMSELDSALEEQRSRIPIEIRPSDNAEPAVPMLDIPVVTFLFAYYNCVSMLHWTVVRNGPETLLRALPQMQTITSFVKLRRAATATIQLLQHLPAPPFADLWRILCYPVSACITLLANVLLCPYSPEARSDAKTIMSFVLFVEKMMKEEGCNLKNVLRGCFEMSKVANAAIVNAGTGAGSPAQGLSQTSEDVASLLKSLTHPMYLAQGLMGNLPNRDAEIVQEFSTALGFSSEEGNQYGCFVPTSLKPETYAFSFGPGGVGQDGASYGE